MAHKAIIIKRKFNAEDRIKLLRTKWKEEVPQEAVNNIRDRINSIIRLNEGGIIPVSTGKLKRGLDCRRTRGRRLGVFADVNYAKYANYPYKPHYYPSSQYGKESSRHPNATGPISYAPGESSNPYFFEKIVEKVRNNTRNLLEPVMRNAIQEAIS